MFVKRFLYCLAVMVATGSFLSTDNFSANKAFPMDGNDKDIEPLVHTHQPLTAEGELGKLIFCNAGLSARNRYGCASCHIPDHRGFTDGQNLPQGYEGRQLSRNTPTIYNTAFHEHALFWDGHAKSLKNQVHFPIEGELEMGTTKEEVVKKLLEDKYHKGYKERFEQVYGKPIEWPEVETAVAAFERTIISADSPFDRYVLKECGGRVKDCPDPDTPAGAKAAQNIPGFGDKQQKGMVLFRGETRCVRCHYGKNFTDNDYHNVGLSEDPKVPYKNETHCSVKNGKPLKPDQGRFCETGQEKDRLAFKTPTLRHVATTGPYMHDGRIGTLEEAVEFMVTAGGASNPPDPQMNDERKKEVVIQLVAFLQSLTGNNEKDEQFKKNTDECPFDGE